MDAAEKRTILLRVRSTIAPQIEAARRLMADPNLKDDDRKRASEQLELRQRIVDMTDSLLALLDPPPSTD